MIEDDIELAQLLQESLLKEEIDTILAFTPLDGLTALQHDTFDALMIFFQNRMTQES